MKTVVIDRKRWHRGKGVGTSALQVPRSGKMCCLGFVCKSYGVKDLTKKGNPEEKGAIHDTRGITMPNALQKKFRDKLPEWLIDSGDVTRIALLNDTVDESHFAREDFLSSIFAKHDIKLRFIN